MTTPTGSIDVAQVRRRHRIEDVIAAAGVELRRAGRGYLACCPFHDDTTPSLSVAGVPDRFHCFGCGATGDVIDFIGRLRGLGFRDAVAYLEHTPAGMPPTLAPRDTAVPGAARSPEPSTVVETERAYRVNSLAWQWYTRPVPHAHAVAHLRHHRGIDLTAAESQLARPLVGHTGHGWTGLREHLHGLDVTDDELLALDLTQRTRHGRVIDTLRDRLVTPIRTPEDRIAGFVGRDTGGHPTAPKYRNPARTIVYDKATSLYVPVNTLAAGATVVVVEGALDALAVTAAAARAGRIRELVAASPLGTAVTHAQAKLSLDLTSAPVIIALDGDPAGREGTLRWVDATCLHARRLAYVASLPDGADPADWLTRHGTDGLAALDPTQRHTGPPGARPTGTVASHLPGREITQLARRQPEPARAAATYLQGLLPGLPAELARDLADAVTAELTRQSRNPHDALTRDLEHNTHPAAQPAIPSAPTPARSRDLP